MSVLVNDAPEIQPKKTVYLFQRRETRLNNEQRSSSGSSKSLKAAQTDSRFNDGETHAEMRCVWK